MIRRRLGETIVIGADIEITVIEISPTRVKLAVGAPRAVTVMRKESAAVAVDNIRAAEFVGGGRLPKVLGILRKGEENADRT